MRLTKYGHSCLLVEESKARILIDPGVWSEGFEDLADLDAIFITHSHQDHLVADNIQKLLKASSDALVYADEDSAKQLGDEGIKAQPVKPGDKFEVAGVDVEVLGKGRHAVIHPKFPGITNAAYLIAGRLLHPGDSHSLPERELEILAVPSVAPWANSHETIDYVRAVKPRVAVPIHDAITTQPQMYESLIKMGIQDLGVQVRVLENGKAADF